MSTVKIKTEPTAAVAKVDVKVKLEPSLSTADIKLEQHTSDIDTKVESDSEASSEEEYIKSENDGGDFDQDQRKVICEHPGCSRSFNSNTNMKMHQHEHRLQTELSVSGRTYTLTRQSLDDRWSCPIPNCKSTAITVNAAGGHIRIVHENTRRHQGQQQQSQGKRAQYKLYFLNVDDFYVNGILCGYHRTIEVFVCQQCKLVPECLLTHLQQKHGYDEKSIDKSVLPESAVNANVNPNINQHTNNPHLASAIREPYQQQHQDIIKGWLCVTSNCGCCGYTSFNKFNHKRNVHHGEQITTVPALVLRLEYAKIYTSCFLITRMDQASGAVSASNSGVKRHKFDNSYDEMNAQNENEDNVDQNETTETFNSHQKQWKCGYPRCGRLFNSANQLCKHRHEHKLEILINVQGTAFTVSRQSLDDRWACPVPDCEAIYKTVDTIRYHIRNTHSTSMKHKRANTEDDENQPQQQPIIKKRQPIIRYLKMDDFYAGGSRCGYHTDTGLLICYECRLVPECLLTHLQQKHGYNEKSIDNAILPESSRIANPNPNINQHTSNPYLASSTNQSSQLYNLDIVRGWLCVACDCGYCYFTRRSRNIHQYQEHKGKQLSMVPALVLRLLYGKIHTSCFLITRLDTTASNNISSNNSRSQHNDECDGDDDGDELVLSDMGDGDELVLSDYSDEDDDI